MPSFEIIKSDLPGVLQIRPPTVFEDFRGSYVELYNEQLYREAGVDLKFVQDDMSVSSRHVLRGLHGDGVTWKLISCLFGKIYLVVVNWDETSPHYRQWRSFIISETNRQQVLVPPKHGLGHLVLTDQAIFHYKQTTYYERKTQFTLLWNDPRIGIWWPIPNPILSARDQGHA
jgi:dTDP-4-dehydrorhamnose 3,5-epimerase